MGRRVRSFSSFFLLAVSLASSLPVLLAGAAGATVAFRLSSDEEKALGDVFLRALSREIEAFLDKAEAGLLLAAAASPTSPAARSSSGVPALLRTGFPELDMVLVLSDRGIVEDLSPLAADYVGMDMSRQAYFAGAVGSARPVWSRSFISIYSGNPTLTITEPFAGGYLVGYISLRSLSAALERAGLPDWATGIVVDAQGVVIAHPDYRKAAESFAVATEELEASLRGGERGAPMTFDGRRYRARFFSLGSRGWSIGILRDPSYVDPTLRSLVLAFAGFLILSWSLGLVLVLRGNRAVAGGLGALAGAARRVAEGEGADGGEAAAGGRFLEIDEALAAFASMDLRVREREEGMRAAEAELKTSLAEKEVLLKEIHHRVKNNLQVISSILRLQALAVEDEGVQALFNECQNRVQAMALIHEQLYRSVSISAIRFAGYVESLAAVVWDAFGGAERGIGLDLAVEDAEIPIDVAVPCGLVLVELMTNALKYAYPEGKGRVRVEYRVEGDRALLAVSDGGVGLPADWEDKAARSLGLSLVQSLAGQLKGRLSSSGPPGARFELRFPRPT